MLFVWDFLHSRFTEGQMANYIISEQSLRQATFLCCFLCQAKSSPVATMFKYKTQNLDLYKVNLCLVLISRIQGQIKYSPFLPMNVKLHYV